MPPSPTSAVAATIRDELAADLRNLRQGTRPIRLVHDLDADVKREIVRGLVPEIIRCKKDKVPYIKMVFALRERGFSVSERTLRRAVEAEKRKSRTKG